MKRIFGALLSVAAVLLCSCVTKVMVDVPEHPVAYYDEITHNFTGKINGSLANVFKSTNLALERDLKYFRCGQIPKDKGWFIYARGTRDIQVVVSLIETTPGIVDIDISYGEDDLVACQKIFDRIVKNLRNYAQ